MLKHIVSGPSSGQRTSARSAVHRQSQPLNASTLSTPAPSLKLLANGGPRISAVINSPLTSVASSNVNVNSNSHNTSNNSNNNNNNNCSINNTSSNNNCNNINNNNNNNNNNYNNNNSKNSNNNTANPNGTLNAKHRIGAREALTSLGLLCLVSLLLALLSLIFLLKISPGGREPPPPPPGPTSPEDYIIVYDVTLALCALSLSLNLCCLLVCAIQFLFAVKLVRAPVTLGRGNKYLQKSSVSRICAVGGFFISIPIFLTGIILYTFTQFHSTPAIITSVLIGIGIVFCGGAMVHNVFVWQKEKTICVQQSSNNLAPLSQISTILPSPLYSNANANHIHSNTTNISNQTQLTHAPQMNHASPVPPVTSLSPNHSQVSFNHSYVPGYGVRPATATPPTPKVNTTLLSGRDASGSISPGIPTGALDLSNATNISPHELSTLV